MRAHRPNDESERAKELFAGRFGEEILPSNCSILSQRTATRPTLRVQVARSQTDHLLLLGARRTSAARLERTRRLVVRVRIMQIISIAGRQCTELDTRLATFLSTLLPIEFNRSCPSEHIGLRVRRAHRLDAKRGAHTFLVSHTSGLCKCVRRAATMAAQEPIRFWFQAKRAAKQANRLRATHRLRSTLRRTLSSARLHQQPAEPSAESHRCRLVSHAHS